MRLDFKEQAHEALALAVRNHLKGNNMTDNTQSADIIQRLDWMNLRFAAESQSDATTRRHQTIVDARQEILRLRQPTQTDALKIAAQQICNEMRENLIEQCATIADDHAKQAWDIAKVEGQNAACASGRNYGARAIATSIRKLKEQSK
jgi:fumarylacetoacetate (FAA) hydrolase family protein